MAGVAAVVGNSHKALAPEIILGLAGRRSVEAGADGLASASEFVSIQLRIAAAAAPERPAPIWADDRFAHSFIEEAQLSQASRPGPT